MVNVDPVTGAVIVTLLIVVAVAAPNVGVVSEGLVDNTTVLPVPVTALTPVLLICNTLPVPAVLNVLLVNVSVVALPTNVSVAAGNVNVPDAVAEACTEVLPLEDPAKLIPVLAIVLLVKVSVPDNVDNVPVVGSVMLVVPVLAIVTAFAPLKVNDAPVTPKFEIVLALLSNPFFATNRLLVAIFYSKLYSSIFIVILKLH
jgi:hypothetical protein